MKSVNLNSDEIYVLGKLLDIEINATEYEIKNFDHNRRGVPVEDMKRYNCVLKGLQEKINLEN